MHTTREYDPHQFNINIGMVYLAQSHPTSAVSLSKKMAPGRNSRKKNKQKVQSLVATVSKEFADSTSMHGIKYIANAEATIEER